MHIILFVLKCAYNCHDTCVCLQCTTTAEETKEPRGIIDNEDADDESFVELEPETSNDEALTVNDMVSNSYIRASSNFSI